MKNLILILFTVFLSLASRAGNTPPAAVYRAHSAYAKGDGTATLREIKESLKESNNHPLVVKNMSALYAAAAKNGLFENVNPGWQFPKAVTYSGIEVHRKQIMPLGRIKYTLALAAGIKNGSTLEQLQVIRYPKTVVFDYAAKIGVWYTDNTSHGNNTNFWTESPNFTSPVPEGLYLINLKLKGEFLTQGWFVLAQRNSSASPVMLTPSINQIYTDGKPHFIWKPFQSPEHQAGDKKQVGMKITQGGGSEDDITQITLSDREATSYKYGDQAATKEFVGPDKLASGNYFVRLVHRETELFGEFRIRRSSSLKVPFSIK